MPLPKLGQLAPDFKLPDAEGKEHSLADYRGRWILLYFYPKDDTKGCTTEAQGLRDAYPEFLKLKIKILGVSVDSAESHKKFAAKYNLPFTLLSDSNKEVVKRYGIWGKKKFMGREYEGTSRVSFVIDPEGKVARVYEKVIPEIHAQEVLGFIKSKIGKV